MIDSVTRAIVTAVKTACDAKFGEGFVTVLPDNFTGAFPPCYALIRMREMHTESISLSQERYRLVYTVYVAYSNKFDSSIYTINKVAETIYDALDVLSITSCADTIGVPNVKRDIIADTVNATVFATYRVKVDRPVDENIMSSITIGGL